MKRRQFDRSAKFWRPTGEGYWGAVADPALTPKSSNALNKALAEAVLAPVKGPKMPAFAHLQYTPEGKHLHSPGTHLYEEQFGVGVARVGRRLDDEITLEDLRATQRAQALARQLLQATLDEKIPVEVGGNNTENQKEQITEKKGTAAKALLAELLNISDSIHTEPTPADEEAGSVSIAPIKETLHQHIELTPEKFKDITRANRRNKGRSQSKHFGYVGANAAGIEMGKEPPEDWGSAEYLHLIAFGLGGMAVQHKDNLVWGTFDCNTQMMFVEEAVEELVRNGHTVHLDVTAILDTSPLGQKYHAATKIIYRITIPRLIADFEFTFDPQSHKQPPFNLAAAIDAAVAAAKDNNGLRFKT